MIFAALDGFERAKKQQRVFDGPKRKRNLRHARDERSPDSACHDDQWRLDRPALRMHSANATVFDFEARGLGIRKRAKHPLGGRALHHLVDDVERTRNHQAGIRIPHRPSDRFLVEQRKLLFGLACRDQAHARSKCLAGADLALEFLPASVVAFTTDLQPPALQEVAARLVELAAIGRGPVAEFVVGRIEDEIRRVRRRGDVRGDAARLLETHDIAHAEFSQEVSERGTDDASDSHDHDVCSFGEVSQLDQP